MKIIMCIISGVMLITLSMLFLEGIFIFIYILLPEKLKIHMTANKFIRDLKRDIRRKERNSLY